MILNVLILSLEELCESLKCVDTLSSPDWPAKDSDSDVGPPVQLRAEGCLSTKTSVFPEVYSAH